MSGTLIYSTTLTITSCGNCGIPFAMPSDKLTQLQEDGAFFWCPNGCRIHYFETEQQKLRKELERKQRQLDWAETARKAADDQAQVSERRRAAAKGQVTRIKNRVANGVCPCCKRTFADLARHMAGKHPDFAAAAPSTGEEGKA